MAPCRRRSIPYPLTFGLLIYGSPTCSKPRAFRPPGRSRRRASWSGASMRAGRTSVLFETGYGPSGLPHIGTFGEVARTSMVRHAFEVLTEGRIATRLIAFSDDMDGLRKVPDNIPNKELVAAHLGKPLTRCPTRSARMRASARTTMRGCAPFSTPSASTTNSPRRRTITRRAGSTRRCCTCWRATTRCMPIMLPTLSRGARRDLFAVPAGSSRSPASSCRSRSTRIDAAAGHDLLARSR